MNRQQYIDALEVSFKAETAGAIAGEIAMLLRDDPDEKQKLDLFRRVEAANEKRCRQALEREGVGPPALERWVYRAAHKLGVWLGEGDWSSFLDRFDATVHPSLFHHFLRQAQEPSDAAYAGVDLPLLEHLYKHETCLVRFVAEERLGHGDAAAAELALLLQGNSGDEPLG
jgi:hypothetical protein